MLLQIEDRRPELRLFALLMALAVSVAGCTTSGPAPASRPPLPETSGPRPAPVPPSLPGTTSLQDLPGWNLEDHPGTVAAVRTVCATREPVAMQPVCERLKAGDPQPPQARAWLEQNFVARHLGEPGILTAYFAPRYPARFRPDREFTAPVRPKPAGLPHPSDQIALAAYADRGEILTWPTDDALAWMRPEDLFFMQIQGSGILEFEDGIARRAAFAATNGQPFSGIARPMQERGLLPANNTSGDAIRNWLIAHRGPEADAVMSLNERYVFFALETSDGTEPVGAAGIPLVSRRSIAVDPGQHKLGTLFWISAQAPVLTGAFPSYSATVMALDTGGAIKGRVRADYYLGTGDQAGIEAGRVRHQLQMYQLELVP